MHTKKNKQAGFTLIELLIVILIVGILAAVGLPMYVGYAKDARMSEGKALVGTLWTSLRGCAQSTGGTCNAQDMWARIGVNAVGVSGSGQWTIGPATGATVALNTTTNQYTVAGFPLTAVGVATMVTDDLVVGFSYTAGGDPPGTFLCSTNGTNPPTAAC